MEVKITHKMRPRINKSVSLVARSTDDAAQISARVRHIHGRKYVYIFDKRIYILPSEEEFYLDNGFTVYTEK